MRLPSEQESTPITGLLLVGHGTRNSVGQAELLETAHQVAANMEKIVVEPAFLELAEPTITQGIERLVGRGIERLVVAPLLLFSAGHAKVDIPRAVSRALKPDSPIPVIWTSPFACHDKILELSSLRFREAISNIDEPEPDKTLLLLVGRGSSDSEAVAQMRAFSQLRAARDQLSHVETCFFAKAQPSVAQMLEQAAGHYSRNVVIQPHLLFEGQLTQSLARQVASMATAYPAQRWIVARHLAPHEILVQATIDIVGSALLQSI